MCGSVASIHSKDWLVYLSDEENDIPLPLNPRAEVLIREAGVALEGCIAGNAVFVGRDATGDEADVPGHLLERAAVLFGTPLAA